MLAGQKAHMGHGCAVDALMDAARRSSEFSRRRVEVLAEGDGLELRQITLLPGEELPFRRNPGLAKSWRVLSGFGHADVAEAEIVMMPYSEISIAPGVLHQIENKGREPLVLIEMREESGRISPSL